VIALSLEGADGASATCWRCGLHTHTQEVCRARRWDCYKCGRMGHISVMCDTIRRRLTGVNQSRREDNTTKQQTSRGERRECVYYTDVEDSRDRRGQLTRREGDDRGMRQGRRATRRDTRTSRDYETSGQRQQESTGKGKNTKVKLKQSKSSCNMVDVYSDVESDDSVDTGEPINLNVPHNF
jgi:hypothetical protein